MRECLGRGVCTLRQQPTSSSPPSSSDPTQNQPGGAQCFPPTISELPDAASSSNFEPSLSSDAYVVGSSSSSPQKVAAGMV